MLSCNIPDLSFGEHVDLIPRAFATQLLTVYFDIEFALATARRLCTAPYSSNTFSRNSLFLVISNVNHCTHNIYIEIT